MKASQSDLTVITKSNDLVNAVLGYTNNSPAKFRFSLTGRMQNLSLDILDNLYRANDYDSKDINELNQRIILQRKVISSLKFLPQFAKLLSNRKLFLLRTYHIFLKF